MGKKERNESNSSETSLLDHQPLPPGALVSTVYGEGTILKYHRMDRIYVVTLKFGVGHLNANSVLCTVLPVEKSALTQQFMSSDKERLAPRDVTVFVVGGGCYAEYQNVRATVRGDGAGGEGVKGGNAKGMRGNGSIGGGRVRVTYGSTDMLNPEDFLNQLGELS